MIVLVITTMISALIIGVILICEWSVIAVKTYEEGLKDEEKESDTETRIL